MYVYVKKTVVNGKTYQYLIAEEYHRGKRRTILHISLRKAAAKLIECREKELMVRGVGFEPTQAYAIGSSARPL